MTKSLAAACLAIAGCAVVAQPRVGARAFPLTVDSIMRGPELVGYPPENPRWSGDSQRLYFEWRQPTDDVAATWVTDREGGAPRRLTEKERREAPLPVGQWDAARRRQLGVDNGDIVVIDSIAGHRIDITRTTATESSPRWTNHDTAVTFVRDNNLFLVPLDGTGGLVQLTDVTQKPPDSRLTDSQRTLRREEAQILDWVEQERARRQRREARDAERALPRFERRTLAARVPPAGADADAVLFADTFTSHYDPEIGVAAVRVLEAAGVRAGLVSHGCCGRPQISKGLLGDARRLAAETSSALYPLAAAGKPILFCEPSCLSAMREDAPALLRGDLQRRARVVADQCRLFEEVVNDAGDTLQFIAGPPDILLHGHCHQRSMGLVGPAESLLRRIPGTRVTDLDRRLRYTVGVPGSEVPMRAPSTMPASIPGMPTAQGTEWIWWADARIWLAVAGASAVCLIWGMWRRARA